MADARVHALFNAARRYCIDKVEDFDAQIKVGVSDERTRESGAARWMLWTIAREIERAVPEDFSSEGAVRDYLLEAGRKANVLGEEEMDGKGGVVTFKPNWTEVQWGSAEKARAAYLQYIGHLTVAEAYKAEEVPFRHIMSATERQLVRQLLTEHWAVDPEEGYWHPLLGMDMPRNVLAMQEAWFRKEVGDELVKSILLRRGIARIWELNELPMDDDKAIDPLICDFWGYESYWSSPELDWLIYVSHESSITFAGDWLIDELKKVWPNWKQRIYTSWDYEKPADP